ncbi:hypothetical protein SEA_SMOKINGBUNNY_71 [Gordonia phage SmokingBunny]|uniref:Uncharacterized protein n=2 Tax=Wizardvirus TaxID=2169658 RepID=A0A515MHL3_9CAUD|nr:hypothetical protein KNU53_gp71 [Gordonia phage SmokingBunny]YP_010103084.1 hypothetical protein KNU63_gp74 [Gordonia phage RogerDodger]QCG77882.1 hypothetical protein SEA_SMOKINGBUNNY_71 [Gordonia phage SmokingBunny]QDM56156.1 hypothetical protein SEA_ROGERDODGER_74 [Gordonia phage RogerDodger]WAA20288.1 hypothetical protein SEA_TOGO_70 [Gordonia phage Togo]
MAETTSYDEAVASLFHAGPGGQCDDCGHFAHRHHDGNPSLGVARGCAFHRPSSDEWECTCTGMSWQGHRVSIRDVMKAVTP